MLPISLKSAPIPTICEPSTAFTLLASGMQILINSSLIAFSKSFDPVKGTASLDAKLVYQHFKNKESKKKNSDPLG